MQKFNPSWLVQAFYKENWMVEKPNTNWDSTTSDITENSLPNELGEDDVKLSVATKKDWQAFFYWKYTQVGLQIRE